ncbi:vitamin B12 transporter [Ereboglobus sp. PH5-5]|uniref:TonB-dependent receptor domain-containing protein n=1 Tax=Ereboglobus sp. PH5-5 TaxID=2940529 RepID=UPI0024049C84|nr:TonB-dependent receptor [Ereboglobus sp. PH5-5]MDF9832381.1 vitamin B12 transporter [Ereboglobus sp. PH5-5]
MIVASSAPMLPAREPRAHDDVLTLPRMAVYSQRVALQEPSAGAFAMPVSALSFEPLVDAHARNMGESQADVTIRGGIFENTGYRAGAAPLHDPQTGHYSAEIPIAPAMLTAPAVLTGAENALGGWNANAGTVAYQWRRVTTSGMAGFAAGNYDTVRGEIYQGWVAPETTGARARRLAFDVSAARAESDGSRPWGESRFTRYNARAQLAGERGQTDLFFGRQDKFIGWPNLYTPYANVFETDDLRTTLIALNHVEKIGDGGDHLALGGAWRRNEDHYVFNRADAGAHNPVFATGPAWHTAETWSAGAEALVSTNRIRWRAAAEFVADEIDSTSLTFGRFNSRSYYKLTLAPERTWELGDSRALTVSAGAAFDDTNRDGAAWSPVVAVEFRGIGRLVERLYASWAASSQVPNYTALNSNPSAGLFRGNAGLGRERADNFEIGARAALGAWTFETAVFYRRDKDLVDWVYSTSLPNARAASPVDVDTLGFELTARLSASWGALVFGYTALTKDSDYGDAAGMVDASFYALNYAKHRLTVAVVARPWRGWEIRLDNEARLQTENALRNSRDDALLTSAGVFFAPSIAGWRGLRFFTQATNVWNCGFEEVPAVPAARRQWCAGVMCSW